MNTHTTLLALFAMTALGLLCGILFVSWGRHVQRCPRVTPTEARLWTASSLVLATLGGYVCGWLAIAEFTEGRVGLGTGIVAFGLLPGIYAAAKHAHEFLQRRHS